MMGFRKSVAAVVVLLVLTAGVADAANILAFYPFPGVSHHRAYWPVLRELAVRGHNVTMVSALKMQDPPKNYKEIQVTDYTEECRKLEEESYIKETNPLTRLWKNANLFMLRDMGLFHTELILKEPSIQWLISSDSKFDLIMGEFSFAEEAYMALSHRFQASYVELTSFGNYHWSYWLYGNPFDTSYIGDIAVEHTDTMNFVQRLHNTVFSSAQRLLFYYYYMPLFQQLADDYIRYPGWQDRPSLVDMLSRNTSMVLMNTHYSLNYPYPLAPHFKEIGGINLHQQDKPLDQDVRSFIDGAKDGVIYFSMGSYILGSSVFGEEAKRSFIQVFSKMKQRILWKWEAAISDLPPNVKTGKWLPQTAILAHPKCKAFISHGGFLSLSETIDKAVPVVQIPIFADQPRNARFVESRGIGVILDIANLTTESISWALNEVLFNPSYKNKISDRSKIFRDKPETALETAVYWTEYVLRHKGAQHLRPAIASMAWYQQAMLDVYIALALTLLLPLYMVWKITRCMFASICGKKQEELKKRKRE